MRAAHENTPRRLLGVSPFLPVALFGVWLLFSGKLEAFHLSVGVVFVALATWLTSRMIPAEEAARPRMRILGTLGYMVWLAWQMVASAIYVMRVILNPQRHLDPRIVEFHSPQHSILGRVMLANSITLTPGTLTVDLEGDVFTVHALTRKTAEDLLSGEMGRRVAALSRVPASSPGGALSQGASEEASDVARDEETPQTPDRDSEEAPRADPDEAIRADADAAPPKEGVTR